MDISKKNTKIANLKRRLYFGVEKHQRMRAAVQFSIMLIASSVMGIIFAKYFISGIFVARNSLLAVRYFNHILPSSRGFLGALLAVVNNSRLELASAIIIMISAFCRFNYLISDIVLVIRGFCDSFLVVFLFRCLKNEFLEPNITVLDFTVYFLSKIALLLLIYAFSKRISACSCSIKKAEKSGLQKIKIKSAVYAVFLTLREILTIIFINAIVCTIIFLMK